LLTAGKVLIDAAERRATLNGRQMELSPREFELLRVMAENRGKALSRDRILAAAWGPRFVGEPKTVDVHVAWLRQKLDGSGLRVTTMRGLGYRLDVMPPHEVDRPLAVVGRGRSKATGPS
jgi:DNA-binding response OmpR family regulator